MYKYQIEKILKENENIAEVKIYKPVFNNDDLRSHRFCTDYIEFAEENINDISDDDIISYELMEKVAQNELSKKYNLLFT